MDNTNQRLPFSWHLIKLNRELDQQLKHHNHNRFKGGSRRLNKNVNSFSVYTKQFGLMLILGLFTSAISFCAGQTTSSLNTDVSIGTVANGNIMDPTKRINLNTNSNIKPLNCTVMHSIFERRGISPNDIPMNPINDKVVRFCEVPSTGTCCTYTMESHLANLSTQNLEKQTRDAINKLSVQLSLKAIKFNEYFRDMLTKSEKAFHDMFKKTYGIVYEANSYLFTDLFHEFEMYYENGNVDLSKVLESFFNALYQKMFTVLNQQYSFDDKYLMCVSKHMDDLNPFGDVPKKLSIQIKRSFVATRTFVHALSVASDAARNLHNIRFSKDCTIALMKMQQCSVCRGFTEKPCANYCSNVMRGCLQHYVEFSSEWDHFVAAMDKLAERLIGPFNIVMVVEPIDIKISEAIMNFQETGQDISMRVFQGCGRPSMHSKPKRSINPKMLRAQHEDDIFISIDSGEINIDAPQYNKRIVQRTIREADPSNGEITYKPMQFSNSDEDENYSRLNRRNKQKKPKSRNDKELNKEPVLDRMVKEIRQKIRESKRFWANLSASTCNGRNDPSMNSSTESCWNGTGVGSYNKPVSTNRTNPEFPSSIVTITSRQSFAMGGPTRLVRFATTQLKNAFNGEEVQWAEEEPYNGSGSGAGDDDDDTESSGYGGLGGLEDDEDTITERIPAVTHNTISVFQTVENKTMSPSSTTTDDPTTTVGYDWSNSVEQETKKTSGSDSVAFKPVMSIERALFTYLVPVVMTWFGGMFADIL